MKRLVLFLWVLMQVIIPTMIHEELYATAIQLELAFFAFALWYFNKVYSKEVLSVILGVFSAYYGYIYLTDQFINYMPNYMVYIEAILVWFCIYANTKD